VATLNLSLYFYTPKKLQDNALFYNFLSLLKVKNQVCVNCKKTSLL